CNFFFQAVDGIRDFHVTGVQTCALPILSCGSKALATPAATASWPMLRWMKPGTSLFANSWLKVCSTWRIRLMVRYRACRRSALWSLRVLVGMSGLRAVIAGGAGAQRARDTVGSVGAAHPHIPAPRLAFARLAMGRQLVADVNRLDEADVEVQVVEYVGVEVLAHPLPQQAYRERAVRDHAAHGRTRREFLIEVQRVEIVGQFGIGAYRLRRHGQRAGARGGGYCGCHHAAHIKVSTPRKSGRPSSPWPSTCRST